MVDGDPRVSVVVPAFNVAGYIEEALASVAGQSVRPLEIIVVDDGSVDGTGPLLDRLEVEKRDVWPPLRVIHQPNAGPSAARNVGLDVARGPLIGFLDADDRWHPQKLERHIALLRAHPEADLTFSWYRSIDDAGRPTGWIGRPSHSCFRDLLCDEGIMTSLVVARRDALERAGRFDEALRAHVDVDLWLRIAMLRPGNLRCVPEVLVDHRRRPGQITADWRRMAESWERVIGKARRCQPGLVAAVERQARARHGLFLAKLAYGAGESRAARSLLHAAWAHHPLAVGKRRQSWAVTAAVLLASLPSAIRSPLFRAIRGVQRRRAASRDAPARPGS
jgi:hypothetical protein